MRIEFALVAAAIVLVACGSSQNVEQSSAVMEQPTIALQIK